MPVTISPEQKKFFLKNGYIEFENLLTELEVKKIIQESRRIHEETPGHEEMNLSRSLPFLILLFKKREFGKIAHLLIEKKPLKLGYDQFFSHVPSPFFLEEDQVIGLLLFLNQGGKGLFFKKRLPDLPSSDQECYFLLVFTTTRLSDETHPTLFA